MAFGTTPLPGGPGVFSSLEERRAAIEAQARNTGQVATVALSYQTTGTGYSASAGYLDFGVAFVAEPLITTGAALLAASSGEPTPSSGVLRWHRNAAGYYIGAKVWARVADGTETTSVLHTFSFTGVAIKQFSNLLGDLTGPIPGKVPAAAR